MKPFLPFIIIIICVAMYFMYISPAISEISVLNAKKAQFVNTLDQSKETKKKFDEAEAAYESIQPDDVTRLNRVIPDSFDSVLFANDVSTIAAQYSVPVVSIKADTTEIHPTSVADVVGAANLYKTTTVTLSLGPSNYAQFIQFLKNVETSLQLFDVIKLTIVPVTTLVKASADTPLSYTVVLNTYSMK